MTKIKVLHIIKSLGRGGAEMLLPETLKMHDTSAFEFHYIYFLPWKNQMVQAIEAAGGKVTCLAAKNNIALLFQYRKIIRYCKENQIQLIHAHLPWAGFVSRLVHRLTDIPVLYTEHNMQERYHYVTKLVNKYTFNFQTLGIGVSEDVTHSITKNIAPKINVRTLLNGVNVTSFVRTSRPENAAIRKQLQIPETAFLIGTVAVFRFQKRLDLWLEILKQTIDSDSNVYGIIVGAGILEPQIKAKQEALGLQGKVIFVGLQTEVKPYYEAMNVFMMTSSFEGLPIALLEAMSMECAIVTTDAGGIKEVITSEKEGLMVDVDNWQTMSEHLLYLKNKPETRQLLSENARKRVTTTFSIQAMVTILEKWYKEYTI
ncbi:glycosyltransferase [Flavobacterium orientale]|uniref:Glycosyl transferase family 1 n=1 Tax=Flavobacterium orientale TaxID=1756020 RepID=A0A916Y3V6_9FLAO|nr:glycosyltransferase [Flavobacterium orientale]GGD30228.1 glycosyl transferase family 1 [Flavobacterium orientale]